VQFMLCYVFWVPWAEVLASARAALEGRTGADAVILRGDAAARAARR
jgi:hypothetical protein